MVFPFSGGGLSKLNLIRRAFRILEEKIQPESNARTSENFANFYQDTRGHVLEEVITNTLYTFFECRKNNLLNFTHVFPLEYVLYKNNNNNSNTAIIIISLKIYIKSF